MPKGALVSKRAGTKILKVNESGHINIETANGAFVSVRCREDVRFLYSESVNGVPSYEAMWKGTQVVWHAAPGEAIQYLQIQEKKEASS